MKLSNRKIGCRTPHGVRELKLQMVQTIVGAMRRTPHGVRELKLVSLRLTEIVEKAHELT